VELRRVSIHGRQLAYRTSGKGPAILLIHGMAGSSETWEPTIEALSSHATVIAPDLPGHGGSDKPRGDYSLGALANSLRDLLVMLGHDHATIVGHSLGGGVAMQFAYQFPDRCDRLVLVSAGGLGREVHGLLRALSAPGAEYILAAATAPQLLKAGAAVSGWLNKVGLRTAPAFAEIMRSYSALGDAETRVAFFDTLRAVIDVGGQRVSAIDRLYLAADLPTLIVWGDRDPFIPLAHGHAAVEAIAGSHLEIFEGSGHFPHRDDPERFGKLLIEFIRETHAATLTEDRLRRLNVTS
jgi:pimeloyl-ACP methyl ester carboxylesterase